MVEESESGVISSRVQSPVQLLGYARNRQKKATERQDDMTSTKDDMTTRQDDTTSRQDDIKNRHRVIFDPDTAP